MSLHITRMAAPRMEKRALYGVLAEQLAAPIRFGDAVARLVAGGTSLIVECGPLRGLGASLDCRTIEDTTFCRMSAQEVA